jgi:hypothetical protein
MAWTVVFCVSPVQFFAAGSGFKRKIDKTGDVRVTSYGDAFVQPSGIAITITYSECVYL